MRTVVALLVLVAGLAAQSRVSGVVRDESGAVLPGARVQTAGAEQVTRDDGRFVFDGIAKGAYILTIDAPGFRQLKRQIEVAADVDVGEVVLRMIQMVCPVEVTAEHANCRDVPGSPARVTRGIRKLATYTVLPAIAGPVEGVIQIEVVTEATGKVVCASFEKGDRRLAGPTIQAVYQWRFPPGQPRLGSLEFRFSQRGIGIR